MMTTMQIEERLAAVEAAVHALQQQATILPPVANWLERMDGSFKDEPAFEQVLAYGRSFRATGSLPPEPVEDAGVQA